VTEEPTLSERLVIVEDPETRMIRLALRQRGRARLTVTGSSMLPTLRAGDAVTITSQPFETIQRGQVIAFQRDGKVIVHRVVGRRPGHLITHGDNMRLLDPPVPSEAYLGEVQSVPPAPDTRPLPRFSGAGVGQLPRAVSRAVPRIEVVLPAGTRAVVPAGTIRSGLPGDPDTLRVGISSAGALGPSALPGLLRDPALSSLAFLVGFTFGRPGPGGTDPAVLPPGAAAIHIRLGEQLEQVPVGRTLEILGDHIAAVAGQALTGGQR
jgi:signal peptidase I